MIYVTSVQGPNPGMVDLNVVHLLCDLRGYESSSWKYYGAISVEYTKTDGFHEMNLFYFKELLNYYNVCYMLKLHHKVLYHNMYILYILFLFIFFIKLL